MRNFDRTLVISVGGSPEAFSGAQVHVGTAPAEEALVRGCSVLKVLDT